MRLNRFVPSVLGVALLVALTGAPAHAEDPVKARELFQEGNTLFDVGQFDKAIDAWQRGYKEKPDPGFLYNIAQAYRLSGDAHKAIFFYKGFLRNSPKAANREDVEQKIQSLQKLIADQEKSKTAPPTGPVKQDAHETQPIGTGTTAPPPASPTPSGGGAAPPPSAVGSPAPSPLTEAPPPLSAPPPAAEATVVATPSPSSGAPGDVGEQIDLGAAIGVDGWGKSLAGSAQASFALVLAGGYTLAHAPDRALEFRVGAVGGFTFLSESSTTATWKEKFWSFLVEPTLRWRVSPQRFSLVAALGVGAMAVSGLRAESALLVKKPRTTLEVSGTQGFFVMRPAFAGELRLTRGLVATLTLAFPYSPKPQSYYYAPIARTELLVGLSSRF